MLCWAAVIGGSSFDITCIIRLTATLKIFVEILL
jgi:hypothetical protein